VEGKFKLDDIRIEIWMEGKLSERVETMSVSTLRKEVRRRERARSSASSHTRRSWP
jgi:hypothetical protein